MDGQTQRSHKMNRTNQLSRCVVPDLFFLTSSRQTNKPSICSHILQTHLHHNQTSQPTTDTHNLSTPSFTYRTHKCAASMMTLHYLKTRLTQHAATCRMRHQFSLHHLLKTNGTRVPQTGSQRRWQATDISRSHNRWSGWRWRSRGNRRLWNYRGVHGNVWVCILFQMRCDMVLVCFLRAWMANKPALISCSVRGIFTAWCQHGIRKTLLSNFITCLSLVQFQWRCRRNVFWSRHAAIHHFNRLHLWSYGFDQFKCNQLP